MPRAFGAATLSRIRSPITGKARYAAFARCYLNEAAVLEARNPSYPGWAAEDYLAITPGNETDFDRTESGILELCRRYRVVSRRQGCQQRVEGDDGHGGASFA